MQRCCYIQHEDLLEIRCLTVVILFLPGTMKVAHANSDRGNCISKAVYTVLRRRLTISGNVTIAVESVPEINLFHKA
jgi:hypothetical protein